MDSIFNIRISDCVFHHAQYEALPNCKIMPIDGRAPSLFTFSQFITHFYQSVQDDRSKLGVEFDWVITAQQVGAYKPSIQVFDHAFETIGASKGQILHVAQSLYHDIVPANALGLKTVWVNRRKGKPGFGATPEAVAEPDIEVRDLHSLVESITVDQIQ